MTPLGQGLLTGVVEVEDPQIRDAMAKMMTGAAADEVYATLVDLSALVVGLCGALGECSGTSASDVLDCVLSR